MHPIHRLIRRHDAAYSVFATIRDMVQRLGWNLSGHPLPPPGVIKRELLRSHARQFGLRVLVETGTFLGDTVWALASSFDEIHSIELDPALWEAARGRFAGRANVHLHQGDSGVILHSVLAGLSRPALFWLDGHYSGEGTARGAIDSPLALEIDAILRHPIVGHVILVDDTRLLTGRRGYPSLDTLRARVASAMPGFETVVVDDVLMIRPRRALTA